MGWLVLLISGGLGSRLKGRLLERTESRMFIAMVNARREGKISSSEFG